MSTVVRASKFRHVYGQAFKKELCYDNLRITSDASGSLIKVNTKYLAVNTGSNVVVIPLNKVGRNSMADGIKLEIPADDKDFTGGAVVDMDFSRHDQEVIAVGFDDGIIRLFHVESSTHLTSLKGHSRKVTGLFFHPTVNGLLASISADLTLKLWDTVSGVEKISTCHPDVIYSFCFNYDGSLMATTCKDRTIRLFDTRSGSLRREKAELFESLKSSQLIWLGQSEYLVSTGFSRSSERQVKLVSSKDMSVVETLVLDTSPGILQPFYDSDIDILYISGRGDSHIHYYELANNKLHFLSSYKSTIPQRSIVFLPKVALDIAETEIARAYKLSCANCVEPISFRVPRKVKCSLHIM